MIKEKCRLCEQQEATIDGRTNAGPWTYMCDNCHKTYGVGLGLGKGQILANIK